MLQCLFSYRGQYKYRYPKLKFYMKFYCTSSQTKHVCMHWFTTTTLLPRRTKRKQKSKNKSSGKTSKGWICKREINKAEMKTLEDYLP